MALDPVIAYCRGHKDRCCLPAPVIGWTWNCNNVAYDEWFMAHCPAEHRELLKPFEKAR